MTDGLTRKVLDFLRWRILEEHSTGLRAIKHLTYGKHSWVSSVGRARDFRHVVPGSFPGCVHILASFSPMT